MPIPPHLRRAASALLLLLACLSGNASQAQQDPDAGSVVGRVVDGASGAPAEGVEVTLSWQAAEGAEPRRETRVTDAQGEFALPSVPAGRYELRFSKTGFEAATLSGFEVVAGQANRADVTLSAEATAEPVPSDVEEFVVIASPVAEILAASRMDADELINTMGAAEFDKLAIGDVADALKFVPGVNVVEGQFAVIRGLEDRYGSTLYNFAPVPSPDPDRQSVQLDLFASDIVSDLVIAKTFGPDLPSNSSGGSINILTNDYPEEFELKLSGGTGFTSNAWDRFIELENGNPIGSESEGWDTLESDYGASFGGRTEALEREFRFKAIINNEVDYQTKDGVQEGREPKRCLTAIGQVCGPGDVPARAGDLSLGELSLSAGKFDFTESDRTEQLTGYLGFGFDLDEEGDHKIDASVFYTDSTTDVVQLKENGFLPEMDYAALAARQANGDPIEPNNFDNTSTFSSWLRNVRGEPGDTPAAGPLWFTSFLESKSFDIERDLQLYQVNGDHQLELIEGLHVTWAGNHAETTQDESAYALRYFFEPDDDTQVPPTEFPVGVDDLGPGQFATNGSGFVVSSNEIDESQNFGRLDAAYELDLAESLTVEVSTGGWYEKAERDVLSTFLEGANLGGSAQYVVFGDTPEELGRNTLDSLNGFVREGTNDSTREITAWNLGTKSTLWEDLDVLAGFRLERIFIESINDPFTGETRFGAPATYPETYLFFDRLDNLARAECSPCDPGRTFNDQLLGIKVPIDPATGLVDLLDEQSILAVVNGEIDETRFLPSTGFTYRLIEGMALRGAWSRTVARPSFREMGYYASVERGSDDLIVGNPQLKLSDVESYDARLEYTWGDFGDLAALSLFYKTIEDPIEVIVIRNPLNAEQSSSALFRTFFNNPDEATLMGLELEGRKAFDFVGLEAAEYFSVGGNFTYIDAEVDRTEAELPRADSFFGVPPGERERFSGLETSRRLYGQPEWIANVDVSFDQPEWGSKATLALFAISDILDAAGSAFITTRGDAFDFTLDRYIDSYYQLDLIMSQRIWEGLTLKVSVKNLTDSKRRIIYDPDQTSHRIAERSFRIGQDYSFSLSYTLSF